MKLVIRFVFCLGVLAAGCAHPPTPLESAREAVGVEGPGKIPVVLQSGLGDGTEAWDVLAPMLRDRYRVVRFDRPGYGGAKATPGPRDPCTIADETRERLLAAGIRPPWLLVGHSLGGLYQYVFARRYPAEVAGLVLLDPTHPRHWETIQQEQPSQAAVLKGLRRLVFSETARREFDDQAGCLDGLDQRKPLSTPARILVSDRPAPMEDASFRAMLDRLRRDWLGLLAAPGLTVIWDSGHYIQKEAPGDVVQAIDALAAGESAR
ncbi:MAG: alpha/beta hydrolase [Rhodocyclaceae bacterium]|nr:alpha/beta hydrolase [Rhodocyclaceae bacterium]